MKYPQLIKKHCSLNCIFPLNKVQCFFQQAIPLQLWRNPLKSKRCSIRFWKSDILLHMISLQIGNIPVPYVTCFSIYNHPFNMQKSCQKCNAQCINTIVLEHHVKWLVSFSRSHVPAKVKIIVFTRVVFMLKRFSFRLLFLKDQVFL